MRSMNEMIWLQVTATKLKAATLRFYGSNMVKDVHAAVLLSKTSETVI